MEEEIQNEEVVEEEQSTATEKTEEPEKKEEKRDNKSFVKIRVEKAEEKIFKELGVKDLEDAKAKLSKAEEALNKVSEIEKQLQRRDYEIEFNNKVNKLKKVLDNEKVFDADALVSYVDIDKIELDASGNIKDKTEIVNQLKELKPNFFGKEFIKTDSYSKSDNATTKVDPYKDDYDNKNYQSVIATYLKNNK